MTMNLTTAPTGTDWTMSVSQRVISDVTFSYLTYALKFVLVPALGILSVCANILNVAVFAKLGVSDGVTQSFLLLSVADGVSALITVISSAFYIHGELTEKETGIPDLQAQLVTWACNFVLTYPQSFSLVTTVVISIVRCLCVTIPFRVKQTITAKRQLAAILGFWTIGAVILLSHHSRVYSVFLEIPEMNMTRAAFAGGDEFIYGLFTNIFYNTGFIIVILCIAVLSRSLHKSSKFRQKATQTEISDDKQTSVKKQEVHVVKIVTVVAVIFIVCYLPYISRSILGEFVDVNPPTGAYMNLNLLMMMVSEMALMINASLNIIFYYAFNTRYRNVCKGFFQTNTLKGNHRIELKQESGIK